MIHDIIIKMIRDHQGSTSPFKTFPFIFCDAESGTVQITFLFCLLAVRLDQRGELDGACERRMTNELATCYLCHHRNFSSSLW